MKKSLRKEIILLTLPAAGLAMFGFLVSSRQPTLSLNSTKVVHLAPVALSKPNPYPIDTSWTINVSCRQSPWYTLRNSRYVDVKTAYIEDAQGEQYFKLKGTSRGINTTNDYQLKLLGNKTYQFSYSANLAQIPKSVGTLTFKTIYVAQDGAQLPLSVAIRQ